MPRKPAKVRKTKISDALFTYFTWGLSLDGDFPYYEDYPREELKKLWQQHREAIIAQYRAEKHDSEAFPWGSKEFDVEN